MQISKNAHDEIQSRLWHLVENPEILGDDGETYPEDTHDEVCRAAAAFDLVPVGKGGEYLVTVSEAVAEAIAIELDNCADIYRDNMKLMEAGEKRQTGKMAADLERVAEWLRGSRA